MNNERNNNNNPINFAEGNAVNGIIIVDGNNNKTGTITSGTFTVTGAITSGTFTVTGTIGESRCISSFNSGGTTNHISVLSSLEPDVELNDQTTVIGDTSE